MQNQAISGFVDQLIEEKDFPDLTDEARVEIKRDLMVRIDDFLAARIIAKLSESQVVTFEKMLQEKKSESEVQEFVSKSIPDFTNFLTQSLLEFKQVYLGMLPLAQ